MNITDQVKTVSKTGNFWYGGVTRESKQQVFLLHNVPFYTRCFSDQVNLRNLCLQEPVILREFGSFIVNDEDIIWLDEDFQERVVHELTDNEGNFKVYSGKPAEITRNGVLLNTVRGILEKRGKLLIWPGTGNDVLAEPLTSYYVVTLPENVHVHSILLQDRLLLEGVHFLSNFGYVITTEHPYTLFNGTTMIARAYSEYMPNIYNYALETNIFGDASHVWSYYRKVQSIKQLKLAAAQAGGLCVVPEDCVVYTSSPFKDGWIYNTDIGKLYAPYPHTQVANMRRLEKDTIIGNSFDIISLENLIPGYTISLDTVLPLKGLYVDDSAIQVMTPDNEYRPEVLGPVEVRNAYWELIKLGEQVYNTEVVITAGNLLALGSNILLVDSPALILDPPEDDIPGTDLLRRIYGDRGFLVLFKDPNLPDENVLRIRNFIEREKSGGTILFYTYEHVQTYPFQ